VCVASASPQPCLKKKTPLNSVERGRVPIFLQMGHDSAFFIVWRKQLLLLQRIEKLRYKMYKYTYLRLHSFYNNANFKKSILHVLSFWKYHLGYLYRGITTVCQSLGTFAFKPRSARIKSDMHVPNIFVTSQYYLPVPGLMLVGSRAW